MKLKEIKMKLQETQKLQEFRIFVEEKAPLEGNELGSPRLFKLNLVMNTFQKLF